VLIGISISIPTIGVAQVASDGQLPMPSVVTGCPRECRVSGGTTAGNNLFHSLRSFSVPTLSSVVFESSPNIQRIFSRVTGGEPSQIDGVIQASADLFLINPAGLRFGQNAKLDIKGGFIGATASAITFDDGKQFGLESSILSLGAPTGLEILKGSGGIQVNGQAKDIGLIGDPRFSPTIGAGSPDGLTTSPGSTLGLVGNGISINRGALVAPSGNIELHGTTGLVEIQAKGRQYQLLPRPDNRADVTIDNLSRIDASGAVGSSIHITGDRIQLDNGSIVLIQNVPSPSLAPGSIAIDGNNLTIQNAVGNHASRITSEHFGLTGANIQIKTAERTTLLNTGQISARSYGVGSSGSIDVTTDSLVMGNDGLKDPNFPLHSIIVSAGLTPNGADEAGPVRINARDINLRSGAAIVGETVSVKSEQIDVAGELANGQSSAIFSVIDENRKAGSVDIQAEQIRLSNKGVIGSVTVSRNKAANVNIQAGDISIIGKRGEIVRDVEFTGIASIAGSRLFGQPINASAPGNFGRSGDINISARSLKLLDGGIATGNLGQGDAGTVRSVIGSADINRSVIYSAAAAGNGGGINAKINRIKALDSQFLVNSDGSGIGGNIDIKSDLLVSFNNFLSANSNRNQAGRIDVTSAYLFIDGRTQTLVRSGLGPKFDGEFVTRETNNSQIGNQTVLDQTLSPPKLQTNCANLMEQGEHYSQIKQGGSITDRTMIGRTGWLPKEAPSMTVMPLKILSQTAQGWELSPASQSLPRKVSLVAAINNDALTLINQKSCGRTK
jgi:filamentous hemagglutinin family protein